MIERYIYDVTRRLPKSQREDIKLELQSLISEMIDKRFGDKNLTNDDIESVLIELGHPRIMADRLTDNRQDIIHPEHYNEFLTVTKVF